MPRLPRISGAEAVIPVHRGQYIGKGLLKAQIDAAGLTVAEFITLL